MDWQQFTALGIVGLAAYLLLRGRFRRRKFSLQRDMPCGCSAAGLSSPNQSTVIYRARKGARPEIIVKIK